MVVALKEGLGPDMFRSYPDEWSFLETYFSRYHKTPSKMAFKQAFPEFSIKVVNDSGHFAGKVREAHAKFLLLSSVRDVTEHLAHHDLDAAVLAMQASIVGIGASMGMTNDSDILTDWEAIYEDVKERKDNYDARGSAGVPTGFTTLDEATGGCMAGDMIIVGARLGEAKSFTLQRMATTAIAAGYNVQFNALEQSRPQVAMRIHAFLSSSVGRNVFDSMSLMQGRDYDIKEYKAFLKEQAKIARGRLHVSDSSRGKVGIIQIAAQIERNKPDIVFIDHITLMKMAGVEWQDVSQLSTGVLQLGQEYHIPMVCASQLNRAAVGKDVAGADTLGRSDTLGQDASIVINQKQISARVMMHKLVKNRNGKGGMKFYSHFDPGCGIYREIDYDTAMDLKDEDKDAEVL